jgi:hypothetical protein
VPVERSDKHASKFISKDTIEKAVVFSPAIYGVATKEGIQISSIRNMRWTVE